jgi:hypothetical protein
MDLLSIVIILVIVGVGLYLINRYVPMAEPIKTILNIVVIVFVCIWLLRLLGVGSMMVGHR